MLFEQASPLSSVFYAPSYDACASAPLRHFLRYSWAFLSPWRPSCSYRMVPKLSILSVILLGRWCSEAESCVPLT